MNPVPAPHNEPPRTYAPRSAERASLAAALGELKAAAPRALPMRLGDRWVEGAGEPFVVRAPHDHRHILGEAWQAIPAEVETAVDAALEAAPGWAATPLEERAAIFLRAAELLAGPWRDRLNAATIVGQSKSVHQAEIDSACELIDFWRWNPWFAARLAEDHPYSAPGTWNRLDLRPLEGFVCAITPFNFTSIAGNLPTAPALMGNVVVWKPAPTQQLAASLTMELLVAAGLPPGVINMVTGDGAAVAAVALTHRRLAGLHFTGSTTTFERLWRIVADNLDGYAVYPRLVGETGGKDFVVAHPSADPEALLVALVRGAFEYQGQKCSAVSRAYLPESLWQRLRPTLADVVESLPLGDPADFRTFLGAVIDGRAFHRLRQTLDQARDDPHLHLVAGGETDDTVGWFVHPTVYQTTDPGHPFMHRELFGPILTVFVYPDGEWEEVLRLVDGTSPYGLTGAVFAEDRAALGTASLLLRQAAGNLYLNDKPTGAVVGQQPFGGSRRSGTNDKAGSALNLLRWTSPRVVKETFAPPHHWRYPHMDVD